MKKSYKLEDLGCANCAQKMEEKIRSLDGVNDASVNFFTCKLKLDTKDDISEEFLERVQGTISKIERDCKIVL